MITPVKFTWPALPANDAIIVYTVPPSQKSIIKGLTIHNQSAIACTFALIVFGIQIYTSRTLGPFETFECASAINKVGIAGDTIVANATAAVNLLGSAIEMQAT
jgi:hypothetical protein